MSRVAGVTTAVVSSLEDPERLGRVQVNFDWMPDAPNGFWAPVSAPMAGPQRGAFFMPEVGDEVLVAFDHGDVSHPFVLGYCWNSPDPPPFGADLKKRGIKTVSGHELVFDDHSNAITLTTQAGYVLKLDEQGMSITLSTAAGVELTLNNVPPSAALQLPDGNAISLGPAGLTIDAPAGTVTLTTMALTVVAPAVTLDSAIVNVTGALNVTGPVITASAIVSPVYTPGAGELAMTILLPAPSAVPSKTDPATGFTILEQPVSLSAQSPLVDGASLTAGTPPMVGAAIARATFTYGALLYRIAPVTGAVQIYNGTQWVAEASFDPADPAIAPVELAFDAGKHAWTGIFLLSTAGLKANDPVTGTQAGGRPAYGLLTIFRTPRKPHPAGAPFDAAVRSPRAAPFAVVSSANAGLVEAGPVHGLDPVKDLSQANGFTIVVKDASGAPAADLIVSGDGSLSALVALDLYAGGAKRASVAIDKNGVLTVSSALSVTIDAPVVAVTGELHAAHVRYEPYLGGPERYL